MRVGYVLRWFPTRSETFVAAEIAGLQRLGVEVEVASLGTRGDQAGARAVDVPVFRAPRGWRRLRAWVGGRPADRHLLQWQRPKDLARLPWLRALAKRRRWDRIHVHFAGEALEAVVAADPGVPVSVTVHGSDLFRPRRSLAELLPRCHVVTVCEHHRAWLARHHGIEASVVRCGVEFDRFPLRPEEPEGGPLRLISVARDVPKKGLDQLLRCLPVDAQLRLVSERTMDDSGRVVVGALPAAAIPEALARAQVFVLPCRVAPDGDRDGVPVALMEAMAVGLPVITTRVSGIPELVDDEVGWLVPPRDDDALRHALEAARDPTERQHRGHAGRARVREGWTSAQQAARLLDHWSLVAD